MIKYIFHLADIHIPNSETKRPYMEMLKSGLAEILKEMKKYNKDEIRIVIAGDIFHNKIKTTNEARIIFHEFLNYLNAMGKTIIVAGNHDMLENNHDRIDSISPTFTISGAYPNITYIDQELSYKSGCIVDDNVIWALYSMHDKFAQPDIESIKKENPQKTIIGLYHGDINGAVTDTGRISENAASPKLFDECDCVMAGHIHKYQVIKINNTPIVYSGSFFQQNASESITKHGYVLWDIQNMTHKHHEVNNKYKIYKFKITDYDDIKNNKEVLLNQ